MGREIWKRGEHESSWMGESYVTCSNSAASKSEWFFVVTNYYENNSDLKEWKKEYEAMAVALGK